MASISFFLLSFARIWEIFSLINDNITTKKMKEQKRSTIRERNIFISLHFFLYCCCCIVSNIFFSFYLIFNIYKHSLTFCIQIIEREKAYISIKIWRDILYLSFQDYTYMFFFIVWKSKTIGILLCNIIDTLIQNPNNKLHIITH